MTTMIAAGDHDAGVGPVAAGQGVAAAGPADGDGEIDAQEAMELAHKNLPFVLEVAGAGASLREFDSPKRHLFAEPPCWSELAVEHPRFVQEERVKQWTHD